MVKIKLTEKDSIRLIKEKLLQDQATNLLNEVLSQDNPKQSNNHYKQANLSGAIQILEDKLTTNPEDLKILDRLAALCFQDNELEASYNYTSRILELDPDNNSTLSRNALVIRAAIFYKWGSYQDSLQELDQAILLTEGTDKTIEEITKFYQDPLNLDNVLLTSIPDNLKELLIWRDKILSKMHYNLNSQYG